MSETTLRQYVRDGLSDDRCRVSAHEDVVTVGVPDASYSRDGINGWIEYKHLDAWPKRATTIVRMKRYTDEQKRFLLESGEHGGHSFLMLQVGREWFLFGHYGAQLVGSVPQAELRRIALCSWKARIQWNELWSYLVACSRDDWKLRIGKGVDGC